MGETLAATTLGLLQPGDEVTIERSVRYGDEVGGHRVSGHVDTVARIVSVDQPENNYVVTFSVEGPWCRYLFRKGFVALDGASLTIAAVDRVAGAFSVWLIPETLRRTRFGSLKPGDRVNLEVDRETQAVVDTVIDLVTQPGFKEWVRDEACA
jgi:riboflavin synthase